MTSAADRTLPLFPRSLAAGAVNAAAGEGGRARQATIEWRDVLRVLATDETTRTRVLARYRERARYTPDDFAHHRPARAAAVDALISAEDWHEGERRSARRDAERFAIRDVRRALEVELWP